MITDLGFLLPCPPRAILLRVPLKSSQKLRLGRTGHPPSSLLRGREESWIIPDLSDAWMGPRWTRQFLFLAQNPVFFNNFSKRGIYTREQGCKTHPYSHGLASSVLQPSSLPYLDALLLTFILRVCFGAAVANRQQKRLGARNVIRIANLGRPCLTWRRNTNLG